MPAKKKQQQQQKKKTLRVYGKAYAVERDARTSALCIVVPSKDARRRLFPIGRFVRTV